MTVPINNPQPDSYGDSVPYQGSMPYYVAQPQVSFPPRGDRISISCGIAGWVIIVLALLAHGAPQVLRALLV